MKQTGTAGTLRRAALLLALTFAALQASLSPREVTAMSGKQTRFYVSPTGNDAWTGRRAAPVHGQSEGPFATLARARDAIRALRAQGTPPGPVTVTIAAGEYRLSEPLTFTAEDSGSPDAPVTYAAARGSRVIISGGRRLTGWKRDRDQLWSAVVPGVKDGNWFFHQLFVNGRRRQRARSPNTGFFPVDGEIALGEPARFRFHPGDILPAWAERGDVEVVALQAWAEFRMPIRGVDATTRTVTLAGQCAPSNREKNARYWVENAIEALDSPGEWYLHRQSGTLYYWPLPGEDMTRAEVIAPGLTELVRFAGQPAAGQFVRDIRLRGLTFAHTDWAMPSIGYTDVQAAHDVPAAVMGDGVLSCAVEGCTFAHLGNYAVQLARGCRENRITGCEMSDLGAGGIKIGEPVIRHEDADLTGGNQISDNRIHDIGRVYPAAVGVWIGQSGGNTVSHNHIHDTFYTGISVGWTWGYGPTLARANRIEFNHVHDIGRGMLSDMGAIYTLGVQPGTVIRGNRFHDVESYGYGGWGIYPDEGSSDLLIENNVVYRTKSGGFHQHYGRDNIVRNNIFALNREAQIVRTRAEPHRSFTFEHNIVYWSEGALLGGNWNGSGYAFDHNLYFHTGGGPIRFAGWSLAEWQQRGQDLHSLVADPRFRDPLHGDFTLQDDSPAGQIGFHGIDLSRLGPRDSRG